MKELSYASSSSYAKPFLDLPGIQKSLEFLLEKIILSGAPVIVSDFVAVYSGISGLSFDSGKYLKLCDDMQEYELNDEEKSIIQYITYLLEQILLGGLCKGNIAGLVPHYRKYTDSESGQSQLLLEFRMRESGQVVDGTRDAVSNFV